MRLPGASVPGWRSQNQASSSNIRNMSRQPLNSNSSWPTAGAKTGTRINTVITKDMMRAISRPLNWSRTSAMETMRGPASE
jgi:hypothetical protein